MDENLYFKILEILYPKGLNREVDISHLIDEFFLKTAQYDEYNERDKVVQNYLENIRQDGYIDYELFPIINKDNPPKTLADCDLYVTAKLSVSGFKFISDYKRDKSTLETNETIRIQSKRQTWILIGALLISLISAYISWLNYNGSNEKNTYLLPSKELIEQLRQEQSKDTNHKNLLFDSLIFLPKKK